MTDITNQLARIERKLDLIRQRLYKPLWVKASVIMELTGWTKSRMQDYRQQGIIEYRAIEVKRGDKMVKVVPYNLHSLSEKFYK